MNKEIVISVKNLDVGFGEKIVLNNLSLDVYGGEILGVVGGSGSGKSVLMRTVLGLIAKRGGSIHIPKIELDAEDSLTLEAEGPPTLEAEGSLTLEAEGSGPSQIFHRQIGVLFQRGALFSSLTVLQNIQFLMREYLSLSAKLLDEIAIAKLEMVGLKPEDGAKFPSELSGGMTKRVALARALALDPELVFLDEPTSGLDPISAGEFDELIKTLQQSLGLTVFMITHDLESLYEICDRIAVLAEGRVVASGPISDIVESSHPWVQAYFGGKRGSYVFNRLNELTE